MKLQEISTIISGHNFRGVIENQPLGVISVVQAKNVESNIDIIDAFGLINITNDIVKNPFYLEYNDIVLVSRGSGSGSFRSSIFKSSVSKTMASSSVYIIRIKDVNVLPKYVSIYLNSAQGQKSLVEVASGGSYIQSLPLSNLKNLEIPIPNINTQKAVIALYENIQNQKEILEKKKEINKKIINSVFINLTS